MRVAITGTPGVGKTTVAERLETDLEVVHLNDLVRGKGLTEGTDEERDSLVADLDAVADRLAGQDDLLFESHLAHHFEADRVVVLRCRPEELESRLLDRGETAAKAAENAEAEAIDVILSEAVDRHGADAVYEIDTTGREVAAVAAEVTSVIDGTAEPAVGTVDFTGYL
jgi:adenylate kinase